MKRRTLNYIVDMGMALSFATVFVSGIFKYRELLQVLAQRGVFLPTTILTEVHRWSGLAMSLLVLGHVALHWKWMVQTTAQFLRRAVPSSLRRGGTADGQAAVPESGSLGGASPSMAEVGYDE